MAGSGDQEEGGSEDVALPATAPASSPMRDRQRPSSPETTTSGGAVAQHDTLPKKLCIHQGRGANEHLEQSDMVAKGPALRCRPGSNTSGDPDTAEYAEKYNRYQAEYVRRLKAKYFSKKGFNGGNIFDQETNIDEETIKSSRWPCTRSFAEPVQSLQESSVSLSSATETSTLPSRKHHLKKSS